MVAFAPTQLHMSQHALVDGFFAFWALFTLWMLWEALREPHNWRWLFPYLFGLSLMVITKENAAFVYFAILVLIAANHWLKWGTVTRELLACTLIGPLLGFVILVFLAGGLETLRITNQLSVSKNYQLTYAIMTGDGPWHRYLVDLLLVSPIVLLLGYRSGLQARPKTKAGTLPEPLYRRQLFGHVQYQIRNEPALRQHVGHAPAGAGVQPDRRLVRFVRALSNAVDCDQPLLPSALLN